MATRNNDQIRRGINRLDATVDAHPEFPSLAAIKPDVNSSAGSVNNTWNNLQMLTLQGGAERGARNILVTDVFSWVKQWRPVILIKIPSAESSLRALPNSGATPDEVVMVALDMVGIIKKNPDLNVIAEEALKKEAVILEADKKVKSANVLLGQEKAAQLAYTDACLSANSVLVRGSEVVRALFGRTSPEYKRFITKSVGTDDEDDTSTTGKTDNNKPAQNNGNSSNNTAAGSTTEKTNTNKQLPKAETTGSNGAVNGEKVKEEEVKEKKVEVSVK